MRRIALLVASALLLPLPAAAQGVCQKTCTVVITMSAGCGSGIKVAPDPLFVAPGADVEISFTIQSEGWSFDDNGIAILLATEEDFAKGASSSKSRKFKHKNKGKKVFKYDVNLVDQRPGTQGQKCKLDPNIVDQ